jgi:hypothetical protein
MTMEREELIERIFLYRDVKKSVHITLKGGTFLRGIIINLSEDLSKLIFEDNKLGGLILDMKLIDEIEMYVPRQNYYGGN